jgi:SAM-dependent methyltransferase
MSRIQELRCYLGEKKTRLLRWAGFMQRDWRAGLSDEVVFWAKALENEGQDWHKGEYRERMDPHLPLQPELRELISASSGATVRILDVGSGPLTRVGRVWPEHVVEITAVDPLAHDYCRIIDRLGLRVPVRPRKVDGERLRDAFPEDSFDLAYASNCLDHSYDPVMAIREMLGVVKPLAFVYLWHFANAGLHERYQGLHQWNFDEVNGDMTISDGRRQTTLSAELRGYAEVDCRITTAFDSRVIIARAKKLTTPPRVTAGPDMKP